MVTDFQSKQPKFYYNDLLLNIYSWNKTDTSKITIQQIRFEKYKTDPCIKFVKEKSK